MPLIKDVSPQDLASVDPSVSGRMLSIACAPDGQAVYAGSYSNLWASQDAGQHFEQLVWPQPPLDQFSAYDPATAVAARGGRDPVMARHAA